MVYVFRSSRGLNCSSLLGLRVAVGLRLRVFYDSSLMHISQVPAASGRTGPGESSAHELFSGFLTFPIFGLATVMLLVSEVCWEDASERRASKHNVDRRLFTIASLVSTSWPVNYTILKLNMYYSILYYTILRYTKRYYAILHYTRVCYTVLY